MHRRPLVEAAVMRVMKAKRRMEHNALVADVTQQLASHFAVQPVRVKQSIESLLEVSITCLVRSRSGALM